MIRVVDLTADVLLQFEVKGFSQHQRKPHFLPLRPRGIDSGGVGQVQALAHYQTAATASGHRPVLRGQVLQEQQSPLHRHHRDSDVLVLQEDIIGITCRKSEHSCIHDARLAGIVITLSGGNKAAITWLIHKEHRKDTARRTSILCPSSSTQSASSPSIFTSTSASSSRSSMGTVDSGHVNTRVSSDFGKAVRSALLLIVRSANQTVAGSVSPPSLAVCGGSSHSSSERKVRVLPFEVENLLKANARSFGSASSPIVTLPWSLSFCCWKSEYCCECKPDLKNVTTICSHRSCCCEICEEEETGISM